MGCKWEILKRIEEKLDQLLKRAVPARGALLLPGLPVAWEIFDMGKAAPSASPKAVAIPRFKWAQLMTENALLQLWDAFDQPAALPAPGTFTVAWTSDTPGVLGIAQDPNNPANAIVSKIGPVGTNVKLDGIVTSTATPPAFQPIDCACFVDDILAGPPTQGTLGLSP